MTINLARRLGLNTTVLKVELSPLFFALGAYKDQGFPMWRIHLPFVRVTVGKLNGRLAK